MSINLKHFADRRNDERGMLLLSTVVISLFVFAIILILAGSALTMVQVERTTKSFIQADNATKHGAIMVRKQLAAGTCAATGSVPVNKNSSNAWNRFMGYSWTIHSSTRAVGDYSNPPTAGDSDVTAAPTCPTPSSTWVVLKIKGMDNFGKVRNAAYTYSYHPTEVGTKPRFPFAFLSSAGIWTTGRVLSSDSPTTVKANVGVMTAANASARRFSCGSGVGTDPTTNVNVTINGDLVTQDVPDLTNCRINGDVNARGNAIVARSSTSKTIVDGNLCASRSIVNSFPGNVTGLQRSNSDVCPGSNSTAQLWRDYNPGTAAISGWTRVNLAAANCPGGTTAKSTTFSTYLRGLSTPTILNTAACGNVFDWVGTSSTAQNAAMKTNVTILAPSFDLSYITISSTSSTARSLNFVTPDTVGNNNGVNERPNCVSPQKTWAVQGANVRTTSPANTFMYSPCSISFAGTAAGSSSSPGIRGQIYSGDTSSMPHLRYVPIQLPGATPVAQTDPKDGLLPHYPSRVTEG